MIRAFFWAFLFIGLFPHWATAERACGEARIVSGASCSTLSLRFDLSSCGVPTAEGIQIICHPGRADAILKREKNTYHIPLRELAPGVWTTVGTLREYPQNWQPPKDPKNFISVRPAPSVRPIPLVEDSAPQLLEVGGQFRIRTEQSDRIDFDTNRGFSSLRLRGDFYFHPSESVIFLLEPQANHVFGEPLLRTVTPSANANVATSGANQDPILSFHQAYVQLRLLPLWQITAGRQLFSYGDEVLVGLSDWENPGRSFDGIRSRLDFSFGFWDVFTTKIWDASTQTVPSRDKDFHGTVSEWRSDGSSLILQPYFFWLRDHRAQIYELFSLGLHTRKQLGNFRVAFEGTGQWGDSSGAQVWAEVQTQPFSAYEAFVGLDAFYSSPDFNSLFPSVHKWLGWADVLGRRNLSGAGGRIGFRPTSLLECEVRGLHFIRTHTDFPGYKRDGLTPLTGNTDLADAHLGSELDAIIKVQLLGGVDLVSAASLFFAAQPLRDSYGESPVARFELSVSGSF